MIGHPLKEATISAVLGRCHNCDMLRTGFCSPGLDVQAEVVGAVYFGAFFEAEGLAASWPCLWLGVRPIKSCKNM